MNPFIAQQGIDAASKLILLFRQKRLVLQECEGRIPLVNNRRPQMSREGLPGINIQMLIKTANMSETALKIEDI